MPLTDEITIHTPVGDLKSQVMDPSDVHTLHYNPNAPIEIWLQFDTLKVGKENPVEVDLKKVAKGLCKLAELGGNDE